MGGPGSGKKIDAHDDALAKARVGTLDEIGKEPVEKVAETDFEEAASLEAFMNERVTIEVHPSAEDGSIEVVVPSVNGVNQPIIRGNAQSVKRKFVEALARSRLTKYIQKVMDPSRPENIQMEERTVLTYPF
ncbi:MAG: hypothetical protein KAV87_35885, partial [Desulfobacteraceae bacterium]|nr:hypothetical protein [Desulfobacteraceae bacterium]